MYQCNKMPLSISNICIYCSINLICSTSWKISFQISTRSYAQSPYSFIIRIIISRNKICISRRLYICIYPRRRRIYRQFCFLRLLTCLLHQLHWKQQAQDHRWICIQLLHRPFHALPPRGTDICKGLCVRQLQCDAGSKASDKQIYKYR